MGLNVNIKKMLGIGAIRCPNPTCKSTIEGLDDYDIECGEPNPTPGIWHLDCYCSVCEREFTLVVTLRPQVRLDNS